MHPIERLRFVARARGAPGDVLAAEATMALATFADEPAALVSACRRVVSRQVGCGPLWWACARLLTADRIRETAVAVVEDLESDTTAAALSIALDTALGADPVVVRATAIGDGGAVVVEQDWDRALAAGFDPVAGPDPAGPPVWLVGGVGVHLSDPMWAALVEHWHGEERPEEELVPLDSFTHVVGPDGPSPRSALAAADCPVAPELFRLTG